MDLQLKAKRALVTGGSRGIGRAIARTLAAEGARIVIAARNAGPLEASARSLAAETGQDIHAVQADTQSDASVDALVARTVALLGGIDIVVNAAASPRLPAPAAGLANTESGFVLEELDIKLVGYLRVARAAAPHLIANGWGRIINISGLAARQTGTLSGSVRNVAVAALTKTLADELGPQGVNVTVVHPGATRTERVDALVAARAAAEGISREAAERAIFGGSLIGRIVEAEELADVVAFLASPRSVAINGDAIVAGGGTPKSIHY